ncbi:MAG: hypothetical protein M3066_18195 [Actinomycetota bacterium]|nr:hypothetical protein [Actinomycetota bacterium]
MRELLRPGGRLVVVGLARSSRPIDGIVDVDGMVANGLHKRYKAWRTETPPDVKPPALFRETIGERDRSRMDDWVHPVWL